VTKEFAIADIHIFNIVDFFAQVIDGSLRMVYGVNTLPFFLSLGVLPAVISASVYTIVVFTTATSRMSYIKLDNIDRMLFKKLLLPSILGCILEAYALSSIPEDII